jgi:hypothetical protein
MARNKVSGPGGSQCELDSTLTVEEDGGTRTTNIWKCTVTVDTGGGSGAGTPVPSDGGGRWEWKRRRRYAAAAAPGADV